jgi:hypothetical protein
MRHPFQGIKQGRRTRTFLLLLSGMLAVMIPLSIVSQPLKTGAAPAGMVSFELAATAAKASEIIMSWDSTARLHAAFSLGLDYLFLVAYSTTIGFACVWAASVLGRRRPALETLGLLVAWGQWGAGLFDATENTALILLLFGSSSDSLAHIAFVAAILKFALTIVGLLFASAGVAGWILSRKGATKAGDSS